MRILVAHNVGRSRTGGMSRIMGYIHDELARDGHKIEYFGSEDVQPNRLHPALTRFTFPRPVAEHARTRASAGEPYDIINIHEPSGAALVRSRDERRNQRRRQWIVRSATTAGSGLEKQTRLHSAR